MVKTIETFIGAAAPIAFGKLYAGLRHGVVGGAKTNPPSLISARHYQAVKYYSLNEHTMAPDVMAMSLEKRNSLSEQQRQ